MRYKKMFQSKNVYGIKLSRILGLKKFIKSKKIKKENNNNKNYLSCFFFSYGCPSLRPNCSIKILNVLEILMCQNSEEERFWLIYFSPVCVCTVPSHYFHRSILKAHNSTFLTFFYHLIWVEEFQLCLL